MVCIELCHSVRCFGSDILCMFIKVILCMGMASISQDSIYLTSPTVAFLDQRPTNLYHTLY